MFENVSDSDAVAARYICPVSGLEGNALHGILLGMEKKTIR